MNGLSRWNLRAFYLPTLILKISIMISGLGLWGSLVAANLPTPAVIPEAEKRAKINELYQKQIPLLERYIQNYPDGPRAAQSRFRLGEAYFETAKYYQVLGQESRVSLYVQKAVDVLEELRVRHPNYDRLDEALLVLASTYLENGDNKKAGPVLAQIANQYPNSPIMNQASFLLGDYYFERQQYAQAKIMYEKAAVGEKSKAYAQYKLAWVNIKQGMATQALQHFEAALKLTRENKGAGFDYTQDISREIVWPALEVSGGKGVLAYLQKTFPEPDLLERSIDALANGLVEKSEYVLASQIFDELARLFPNSPKQGEWAAAQLKVEEKLGRSDRILTLVSRLKGTTGGAPNANVEALQSEIYNRAKRLHAEAQKEKDGFRKGLLLDQALAYYKAFDDLGITGPKAAETAFFRGEALYSRGKFPEALQAYLAGASEKNDQQMESLWNAYLTAEKLATGFQYQGKELQAPSAPDEEFLRIAKRVSEDPDMAMDRRRAAAYQAGRLLYQLNDFERSLPLFQSLAENHAHTKEGKLSADLVLDIYNLRKDYASVAKYAKNYQAKSDSAKSSEFNQIEQAASLKLVQEEEVKAKALPDSSRGPEIKKVADQYMKYARDFPRGELVDSAIFASVQLYADAAALEDDREFKELRASFDLLVNEYRNSKHRAAAIKILGEFLALRQPDSNLLSRYADFRSDWVSLMRSAPESNRGPYAMLIYNLSNGSERTALEPQMASLPVNSENRVAIAHGRIGVVRKLKQNFDSISMNQAKTLTANTKKKVASLEKLETEVTQFVQLGVAKLSVESLNLLADAFQNMGQSLRLAPTPSSITGDDLTKYRAAVEEKASVYDERAKNTRELAERAATEKGAGS